jgi:hypothetical protein
MKIEIKNRRAGNRVGGAGGPTIGPIGPIGPYRFNNEPSPRKWRLTTDHMPLTILKTRNTPHETRIPYRIQRHHFPQRPEKADTKRHKWTRIAANASIRPVKPSQSQSNQIILMTGWMTIDHPFLPSSILHYQSSFSGSAFAAFRRLILKKRVQKLIYSAHWLASAAFLRA